MSTPYAARAAAQPSRGLAIASLVLGILSLFTFGCLGIGAIAGLILGIVALVRAGRQPAEYGGKGMAVAGMVTSAVGLVLLPFVAIVAAVAIPSLLRARIAANENTAIGDLRSVISAQATYQSANAGYYEGRLNCLATPSACIPGYPADGPVFLDAQLASLEPKAGYRREFHAAAGIDSVELPDSEARRRASPTSVTGWALIAVPLKPGQTGTRGFCADASGTLCATRDGSAPEAIGGACDTSSCEPL